MTVENADDLAGLQRVGAVVAMVRDEMARHVNPGLSTADLDAIGRELLQHHGARSAPILAYGFPGATCISVNDTIAHGVPSKDVVLCEGDLVNIDVSAELDGYWADTGASYPVGPIAARKQRLLTSTKRAQAVGMYRARAGESLRSVGRVIERRAQRDGFYIVRNLGGHGVGRHIHEEPHVANHARGADRFTLHEGLVLTIEPFLTMGPATALEGADGWTLRTSDGSIGAQFEHTFVVTGGPPLVLTH